MSQTPVYDGGAFASGENFRANLQLRPRSHVPQVVLLLDLLLVGVLFAVASEGMARLLPQSGLWAVVYGLTALRVAVSLNAFLGIFAHNLYLFAFPAVCVLSTIWSVDPGQTLGSALQLFGTILFGAYAGRRFDLRTLSVLLLLALCIPVGLSLVNFATGIFGNVYAGGGGLLGVFPQKNLLGKASLITALTAFAVMLTPRMWFPIKAAIAAPLFLIAAFVLLKSQSITSLLLLPVGLALIATLSYRVFPRALMVIIFAAAWLVVALAPMAFVLAGFNPVEAVLTSVGKNSTLTGRTGLWAIADNVIDQYWLLGVGYNAFWSAGRFANFAYAAQMIGGENIRAFHNFIREVWVSAGLLGVTSMGLFVFGSISTTLRHWRLRRDVLSSLALSSVVLLVFVGLLEPTMYRQHELSLVLIAAFAASTKYELLAARSRSRVS